MPTGSIFYVLAETHAAGNVASENDMTCIGHGIGKVMQPRPAAICKDDVVRVAFALQERKDEVVSAIYSDEFG